MLYVRLERYRCDRVNGATVLRRANLKCTECGRAVDRK